MHSKMFIFINFNSMLIKNSSTPNPIREALQKLGSCPLSCDPSPLNPLLEDIKKYVEHFYMSLELECTEMVWRDPPTNSQNIEVDFFFKASLRYGSASVILRSA